MSGRKKISQREAMRTRRDLKRLREFVDKISGSRPSVWRAYSRQVGSWRLGESVVSEMNGVNFGAATRVVFVASREGTADVSIHAVLWPEVTP